MLDVALTRQTPARIALGWTAVAGNGYLFTADSAIRARTPDPNRAQATFRNVYSSFEVASISKGATGTYPPLAGTLSMTVIAETDDTITFGWTPQAGYGYLFSGDGNVVSRTYNQNRAYAKFNKVYSTYEVAVLTKNEVGTYPATDGLDLPLIDWEGGPDYWTVAQNGDKMAKAEAAGWSDPSFFPIGVFLSEPSHADDLLAIGINHMIGANHTPPLTTITDTGMMVVPQFDEWTTGEVGSNALAVGWLVHDEPDLNITLAAYQSDVTTVRNRDDGRFVQTNYAMGILRTHWWNADQGGGDTQMDIAMPLSDVSGVDQYCYTSPGIGANIQDPGGDCGSVAENWPGPSCDNTWVERCAAYGWCIDMLRSFPSGTDHPQYITIETKMPYLADTGRNIILYAEIEAAIFSALAHECRGIMYFQHNGFYGGSGITEDPNTGLPPDTDTYSLVDCEQGLRDYIEDLNARITALAPVLNTQSYVFDFGAANIDTMLKAKDGFAYIFASMGFEATTGSKTFTLTGSGITGTSVEVVDESRSIGVSGGQFTDTFANEYTHHIYKVAI